MASPSPGVGSSSAPREPASYCVPLAQNRRVPRREAMLAGLAACGVSGAALPSHGQSPATSAPADARRSSPKRYRAKKSINQWAFPYPDRMTLDLNQARIDLQKS